MNPTRRHKVLVWIAAPVLLAGCSSNSHAEDTASPRLEGIVYLAPASQYNANLYLSDLDTGDVYQLTFSEDGVEHYAVSLDGQQIAYTERRAGDTSDIFVLDLAKRTVQQVTNCADVGATCTNPAWHPDGRQLAYQRHESGSNASRVWVVDLNTRATRLLYDDPQIIAADPVWSPTGDKIAVFDATLPGIRVHELTTGNDTIIQSEPGAAGRFSPDGTRLVYPVLARGAIGQEFYTHVRLVDLTTNTYTALSGPDDAPIEDADAIWSPDGQRLVLARRYLDERFTPGRQLYSMTVASGEVAPLVVDPAYNHAAMRWEPDGQRIVFQRFALAAEDARPEIWLVEVESGDTMLVAADAFLPGWVH